MKKIFYHRLVLIVFLILSVTIFLTSSKASGDFLFSWDLEYGFNYPQGIASDGSGNIYVSDTYNNIIQVISYNGVLLNIWGSPGTGYDQFSYPRGIDVDGIGNVYVVDSFNHRVQVFSGDGTFLGQWGSFGTGEGQFYYPYDVAFDEYSWAVYVADSYNNRIQAFDSYGELPTNEIYNFSGFLHPLDYKKVFKRGSAVPVKFTLTDANGDYISTAQASIMLQKYFGDEPHGDIIEPTSKGRSNFKNTFRYDVLDDLYIYNLDTKGLSDGMWQIIVSLDDGTIQYATIFLRK